MSDICIKICKNCNKEKPIEQFPLCRKWRGNICKICRNKSDYIRIKSNHELYKNKQEANKRHYTNNPIPKKSIDIKETFSKIKIS